LIKLSRREPTFYDIIDPTDSSHAIRLHAEADRKRGGESFVRREKKEKMSDTGMG